MPRKPKGAKNSASKNTMNPPASQDKQDRSQTRGSFEQDPKHGPGQYGGMGEPPLQKK